MFSSRTLIATATLASLAACSTGYGLTVPATRCNIGQHQALVGMNIGEVILPAQLDRREISPGEIVTLDYQPGRLNIFMDAKGWIARVTCG